MSAPTIAPAVVNIAGVKGSVEVMTAPGSSVADVLLEASRALGVSVNTDDYDVVVNGEDAELTDTVEPGAQVDAATPLANGAR